MRKLLSLVLATVSALGLMLFGSGTASATGEWLGCRIAPGSQFNFTSPCQNTGGPDANGKFGVAFMVQNETVASTYSWAAAPTRSTRAAPPPRTGARCWCPARWNTRSRCR